MNMPYNKTLEEGLKEFEKGYYSFRFEYTDKDGKRRYETGVWNDGMAPEEALKHIAKHVSGYEDGKITDFIDNQHFKSFLTTFAEKIREGVVEEVEGMKKTEKTFTYDEPNLGYDIGSYNGALDDLLAQLKK